MLMIGVSTGQNYTNLIPAVQIELNIDRFILLETEFAKNAKWSEGISKVLINRNIKVETIDLKGIDSNIVEIYNKVSDEIKDETEPIYWNLGGGQKPQQFALWELFKTRNIEKKIKDIACYTNQNSTYIENWIVNDQKAVERGDNLFIDINLTAKEIFLVGNYILVNNPTCFYKKGQTTQHSDFTDLFQYREFRKYFFELSKPKKVELGNEEKFSLDDLKRTFDSNISRIENIILKKLLNISPKMFDTENKAVSLSKSIRKLLFGKPNTYGEVHKILQTPNEAKYFTFSDKVLTVKFGSQPVEINYFTFQNAVNHNNSAKYFESVLIERVKSFLENNEQKIIEAYSNLEIAKMETPGVAVGEYDVLLVTNRGTVIALDAKTFDIENKDLDARLYNLTQSAGAFMSFSAVIPLDYDDLDADFIPKKLIGLLFDKTKQKIKFYVISNSTGDNPFWIKKNVKGEIEKTKTKPAEPDWVECKPITASLF